MTDERIVTDREIWTTAGLLLQEFGDMASFEASKKADSLLDAGDLAGQRVSLRVVRAIVAMTNNDGLVPH